MIRKLAEALALFATPLVVYALVVAARQHFPMAAAWSVGRLAMLTVMGLALVVLGMVGLGLFSERYQGALIPAHIENGRLVPGRLQ